MKNPGHFFQKQAFCQSIHNNRLNSFCYQNKQDYCRKWGQLFFHQIVLKNWASSLNIYFLFLRTFDALFCLHLLSGWRCLLIKMQIFFSNLQLHYLLYFKVIAIKNIYDIIIKPTKSMLPSLIAETSSNS